MMMLSCTESEKVSTTENGVFMFCVRRYVHVCPTARGMIDPVPEPGPVDESHESRNTRPIIDMERREIIRI